jgi:hypothetical protein
MARLYRLTINKRIGAAEAARLVYILREVRASIESIPLAPAADTPRTIIVHSVPEGRFLRTIDGEERLMLDSIEHETMPQTMLEAPHSVSDSTREIFDRARDVESIEDAQRRAELDTMSIEELRVLADVDPK